MSEIILSILFVMIGLLSLLAAIGNWEWFFASHNASFFVRYLGRTGSRFFYGLLGIALIFMAGILFHNPFLPS